MWKWMKKNERVDEGNEIHTKEKKHKNAWKEKQMKWRRNEESPHTMKRTPHEIMKWWKATAWKNENEWKEKEKKNNNENNMLWNENERKRNEKEKGKKENNKEKKWREKRNNGHEWWNNDDN